jgi:site-specific recombinase XerD
MDERLQAIESFEAYLKRRAPESRTWVDYISDVRQFAACCAKQWAEVKLHDIDAFIDQQRQAGLSPATLKRRLYALKVFFDFLAEEADDLSRPNPVRSKRHRLKAAKRLPRDLSDEQVSQLWAVIDQPRDRAWFALMLRAGLRVAEVVGLTLAALLRPAQANNRPAYGSRAKARKNGWS